MQLFYTDHFELPLPDDHRFPMAKYQRLRERVAAGELGCEIQLCVPPAATDAELRLSHTHEYIKRVVEGRLSKAEVRRIGFPWSPEMVERSRRSTGATIAAAAAALEDGVSANLAGGTHHAFPDAGEGYCVFNDTAVAARALQARDLVATALIIDCDVHQGNGTAAVLAGDPSVRTFSMHGDRNFPFRKEASDIDIALRDGTGGAEYLDLLRAALPRMLDGERPDLVFYIAGADPYEGDRLGRLALTKADLEARDHVVLSACVDRNVPVAIAMGGGYADDVEDITDIHLATLRIGAELAAPRRTQTTERSTAP